MGSDEPKLLLPVLTRSGEVGRIGQILRVSRKMNCVSEDCVTQGAGNQAGVDRVTVEPRRRQCTHLGRLPVRSPHRPQVKVNEVMSTTTLAKVKVGSHVKLPSDE